MQPRCIRRLKNNHFLNRYDLADLFWYFMNISFCKYAVIFIYIYTCVNIWFRIMFCMFVSSTFLLCGFNIVCKLHNFLIENEHDTLSIIVRPTIHALAQVSSEKFLISGPCEPNVSCLHYIDRDLWPFVDLNLQNLSQKWIAHNKLT